MTIITISSEEHNNYFFTTDHCQHHGLDDTYVPCTYYLPMIVAPREAVPDGIVDTKEKLVAVFYKDKVEILNPDPKRILYMYWWNNLTLEQKFYKVISWLSNKELDTTSRHPDTLSYKEIEEIHTTNSSNM